MCGLYLHVSMLLWACSCVWLLAIIPCRFTHAQGANFTLIGALAGIMWVTIIRDRGVTMNYLQFFKLVWMSGVASTIASLFILWAEFAVMT